MTNDQWVTREIVRLQMAGASDYFRAELDLLRAQGRDVVSFEEMQTMINAAWDKSGKRAWRNESAKRHAVWGGEARKHA